MIRNSNGKWIDSNQFKSESIKYETNGTYCSAPYGSPEWYNYWQEQLRRCKEGFKIGNEKVTGHHYMYLNFTQIEIVKEGKTKAANKRTKSPDFWDGDFDYFWCLEIAKNGLLNPQSLTRELLTEDEIYRVDNELLSEEEEKKLKEDILYKRLKLRVKIHPNYLDGGFHMIVGKSRRKGYSYKNGAICANVYNTERMAQIIIGAFEKKFLYPKGTMGMTSDYLNHLNETTGWSKSRDYVDKQDHRRASYKSTINGTP